MITWNPNIGNGNLSEDKLTISVNNGNRPVSKIHTQGKWYCEFINIDAPHGAIFLGQEGMSWGSGNSTNPNCFYYHFSGNIQGGIISRIDNFGKRVNKGDILGVALDIEEGIISYFVNGEYQNSISNLYSIFSKQFFLAGGGGSSSITNTITANFGATEFDIVTSNPEEWNRLKSEGYLPYDFDSAKTTWWGANIENVNISKTNIWHTDKNNINLSCFISHPNNEDIKYKILVNNTKAVELDNFISTPTDINIDIPIDLFTKEENLLELVVFDEGGVETSFKYNVIKENRDTFTFKRIFDFKEDYITDENIEVMYGGGLALKEIGTGEVNIEIPTEGKSKISNIVIEGGEDKEEELTIEREMTYLNDLGEGKVHESRLLTEYTDIVDIEVI